VNPNCGLDIVLDASLSGIVLKQYGTGTLQIRSTTSHPGLFLNPDP